MSAICPGMIETDMVRNMAALTNPDDPQSALKDLARVEKKGGKTWNR